MFITNPRKIRKSQHHGDKSMFSILQEPKLDTEVKTGAFFLFFLLPFRWCMKHKDAFQLHQIVLIIQASHHVRRQWKLHMWDENSYEPMQMKTFFDLTVKIDGWVLRSLHRRDERWEKRNLNFKFPSYYVVYVLQVYGGAESGHTVRVEYSR